MAWTKVGYRLCGVLGVACDIPVAANQYFSNLWSEEFADMGNEWLPLPQDEAFIPMTDTTSGPSGKDKTRNVTFRHHRV